MENRDQRPPAETGRPEGPPGEEARASLRRAKKALGSEWSNKDASAPFYLEEAKVLALLELADAIRNGPQAGRRSGTGAAPESS
jgi:hypothetical protein